MSEILLEMKEIHKQFSGVYALKGVDLTLHKGEVHALLGENGAGKSTLIKVLGGIYKIDQGEIFIESKRVEINSVKDAQNLKISIIHQEIVLVPYMTVAENIFLGREIKKKNNFIDKDKMEEESQKLLDAYHLNIKASTLVRYLTIAQQQMVEIIKAISQDAKILVMDEPTSSLSDKEIEELFKTIGLLKEKNVGIIYISHRMSELKEIADRVTVLRDGQYIGTRCFKNTSVDELIGMMVGRALENYYARTYNDTSKIIMDVKGLNKHGIIENISFSLRKGEILGFAGLVGAGRSDVVKSIFGLESLDTGEIWIEGQRVKIKSPIDAIKYGIALVPESRKEEALYPVQGVRYNLSIEVLKEFIKGIIVKHSKEKNIVEEYIDGLSIKTTHLEQEINNLSGGNQQKIIIARWLATKPKILILDEPTRGIDVGAKAEIYHIMNELVKNGVSIIMISSELPEIINMSDRVMVMNNGKIIKCLLREELTQENIMSYAVNEGEV